MKRVVIAILTTTTLFSGSGCNILTAGAVLFAPRQIDKRQFELTDRRLAVFIDYARPEEENPVFDRALYDQVVTVFREQPKFVASQVVPFEEMLDLRRANRDFKTWSVQRVGRELDADQVLYVRIGKLHLRATPDYPLLEPAVTLHFKVIGVPDPALYARLWPEEEAGRQVQRVRRPVEASGPDALDAEAAKLGREVGREIAYPFYDVDTEETVPKET